MEWISAYHKLENDMKLKKFAKFRGGDTSKAIGDLIRFWWRVSNYAPDGDLTSFKEDLLDIFDWTGEEDQKLILEGLKKSGFIIENANKVLVQNWMKYSGNFIKNLERKRELARETERKKRENKEKKALKNQDSKPTDNKLSTNCQQIDNGLSLNCETDKSTVHNKTEEKKENKENTGNFSNSPVNLSGKSEDLKNIINLINQHSGFGSSLPPYSDLGKLRDEILSGILPSLHRGNFDKVDKAKIAEKWNEGITTGEEWMQFFIEISLSSFLQGKKKIPNKNNGECYKTSFSYCIDHFGEVLSGKWRDTPEEPEEELDFDEIYKNIGSSKSEEYETIECQNYSVEEV